MKHKSKLKVKGKMSKQDAGKIGYKLAEAVWITSLIIAVSVFINAIANLITAIK